MRTVKKMFKRVNLSISTNPLKSKMAISKDESDLMQLVTDDIFKDKVINAVDLPYYIAVFDLTKSFLLSIMTDEQKAYHKELLERYNLMSITSAAQDEAAEYED